MKEKCCSRLSFTDLFFSCILFFAVSCLLRRRYCDDDSQAATKQQAHERRGNERTQKSAQIHFVLNGSSVGAKFSFSYSSVCRESTVPLRWRLRPTLTHEMRCKRSADAMKCCDVREIERRRKKTGGKSNNTRNVDYFFFSFQFQLFLRSSPLNIPPFTFALHCKCFFLCANCKFRLRTLTFCIYILHIFRHVESLKKVSLLAGSAECERIFNFSSNRTTTHM